MTIGVFNTIKKIDWVLILITVLLVIFGLITIYSIGENSDPPDQSNFYKQLVSVIIGMVLMVVMSLISFRFWKSYSFIFYIVGLILLVIVLIFGIEFGGTKGWLKIGNYTLQPVEFVKIFTLLFLAQFFSSRQNKLNDFKTIILSALAIFTVVALILIQPDLGSAAILLLIWLGILLFLKFKKSHIAIVLITILILMCFSWFFILADYQKDRILTFINPNNDPLGQGYNITQSIISVGSGQLYGRGLGLGPQSQLNFLPTKETDFIFSVISEELGFIGAGIVIILFVLFFWRICKILKNISDSFSITLIIGAVILFFSQFIINIGMNLGLMPITGLPLPFISLAGTSIIANFAIIGILQNIIINSKK